MRLCVHETGHFHSGRQIDWGLPISGGFNPPAGIAQIALNAHRNGWYAVAIAETKFQSRVLEDAFKALLPWRYSVTRPGIDIRGDILQIVTKHTRHLER